MGTLITSRGCPFRCTFCDKSVSGSRWRARSAQSVVDEMTVMVEQYGIRFINIYDDNFTLNRGRVMAICEEILARGLVIDWKCEGRVDAVDKELLELMKRAGCKVIAFGVESANRETLALLQGYFGGAEHSGLCLDERSGDPLFGLYDSRCSR